MTVWIPLRGPDGPNPKACKDLNWTKPDYAGILDIDAAVHAGKWVGMRLDDFIVIDCDCEEAKDAWLEHIGLPLSHTWVRKTPHGYHLIYRRTTFLVEAGKPKSIHPKIDLKVGPGHQIVFHAGDLYRDISATAPAPFDPAWIPEPHHADTVPEWDQVEEGGRNSFLTSVGGFLRAQGMSVATLADVLYDMNTLVLAEPLPTREVRAIARSLSRYSPGEKPEAIICPNCQAEIV